MHVYLSKPQRQACINALRMSSRWLCGDIDVFMDFIEEGKFRNKEGGTANLSAWSTHIEPGLLQLAHQTLDVSAGGGLHPLDPGAPSEAALMYQWMEQLQALRPKKHTTFAAMPFNEGIERVSKEQYRVWLREGTTPKTLTQRIKLNSATATDIEQQYKTPTACFQFSIPDEKVHTLLQAIDTYSRLLMGQWTELITFNGGRWTKKMDVNHTDMEKSVRMLQQGLTGFELHASHGIHNPCLDPDAKIGFDVYKAIRHWDYVHRNGYGLRQGVSTDAPWSDDTWPLVEGGSMLETMPVGSFMVGNESRMGGNKFYLFEQHAAYPEGAHVAYSYSPVSCLDDYAAQFPKKQNTPPTP